MPTLSHAAAHARRLAEKKVWRRFRLIASDRPSRRIASWERFFRCLAHQGFGASPPVPFMTIFQLHGPGLVRAVSTAVDRAVLFDAVSHDVTIAMGACRCQG